MKVIWSPNPLIIQQGFTHKVVTMEYQRILQYLSDKSATVAMIKHGTGLSLRAIKHCLTELRKAEMLWTAEFKPCELIGEPDQYYTSNPDYARPCLHQLKLWEGQGHE